MMLHFPVLGGITCIKGQSLLANTSDCQEKQIALKLIQDESIKRKMLLGGRNQKIARAGKAP